MMLFLGSLFSGALGLLGKVPVWAWFVAGALVWGWWGNREASSLRKGWAEEKAATAVETARTEALYRAEERRREIEKEGVVRELTTKYERARVAGAAESDHADKLQRAIADLKAGRAMPGHSQPVPPVEAAERLGTTAGECVAALRKLVEVARRGNIAGTGCEAEYDSLTSQVK